MENSKSKESPNRPITVIIPSYNNKTWYRRNLQALFRQDYENYKAIYIDDCSTDGTADLVEKFLSDSAHGNKVKLIRNTKRCGPLQNRYEAIHSCDDDDIIVTYDGDDWFYHDQVLSKINQAYRPNDIWLTYGNFINFPDGKPSFLCEYPEVVISYNRFRDTIHPSHLRTFYAWLFKKIHKEDLLWNDHFFQMATDLAMMYPMIEMASERHKFIEEVLYVYNQANPGNLHKIDLDFQDKMANVIRHSKRYSRLIDEDDTPMYDDEMGNLL